MNTNNDPEPGRFSEAAAAGLRVFPVLPRDKKPAVLWTEFQTRQATPEEIAIWDASDFNVGIICGAPSGIVVLDVDSPEAQADVDALQLPLTPCVRTAKGQHFYFKAPSEGLRNQAGIEGKKLDFRGDGGYVVGAGSIHEHGARYEWVVSPYNVAFAEVPKAVLNLLNKKSSRRSVGRSVRTALSGVSRFHGWLLQHLEDAKSRVGKAQEGWRNDTLISAASLLARHVAAAEEDWAHYAAGLAKIAAEIGLEEGEIANALNNAWGYGLEDPKSWISLAQEWVYVSGLDRFRHLATGEHLTPQAFRTEFRSLCPDPEVSITTFLTSGYIQIVQNVVFDPSGSPGVVKQNGRYWLNIYRPSNVVAVDGDPTKFIDFVKYLVPDDSEREHLLKMFAHMVQRPGEKLHHALILGSKEHGIGKSTLIQILFELLGPHNCRKASSDELEGPYNAYIEGTLLVLVEEINLGAGGRKVYNKLKDQITGETTPMRRLYQDTREIRNVANFVFLTNLERAILLDKEDRRYFVLNSPAQPQELSYYVEFNSWWRENLGVIRAFLEGIDLGGFNRSAPAPVTEAKLNLIKGSEAPVVQELREMIFEREAPFHVDIVTYRQVAEAVQRGLPKTSRNAIEDALRAIEAVPLGQHRMPKARPASWRLHGGHSDRPSLWAVRNQSFWKAAASKELVEEYLAAEGRLADLPQLPPTFGYMPGSLLPPSADCPRQDEDQWMLKLLRDLRQA